MQLKCFENLVIWSQQNFSQLPWRKKRSLYTTLVSEIMLQQTTVSTVKNHFEKFLNIYPSIKDLAASKEEDVLRSWQGLGYYRRARNLHNIAKMIVHEYGGIIPTSLEKLKKIKGVGPYTAAALLAIGDNQNYLAIDANLERVLSRVFGIMESDETKKILLYKKIGEFKDSKLKNELKKLGGLALNEAFMDLGRTICQKRKVSCEICQLSSICVAHKKGNPYLYPFEILETKKQKNLKLELLRVFVFDGQKLLGYQKTDSEWLTGQFECPTFIINSIDKTLRQYPEIIYEEVEKLTSYKTAITKYNITNKILILEKSKMENYRFLKNNRFKFFPIKNAHWSTATLKGIHKYLKNREKV